MKKLMSTGHGWPKSVNTEHPPPDSPSWIISVMCGVSQDTRLPLFIVRVLLLVIQADKFPWWIELLRVLGGEEYRRLWFPCSNWQLPFPGQLLALHGSCVVRWAPETTVMSSRTSGSNKVISVQHVSKCSEKKVWTDGQIYLFHSPLMNLTSSFAHGMFVFHTLTFFFPDRKFNIWKLILAKLTK